MAKKLTDQERRYREVSAVVHRIVSLEKQYGQDIVKGACYRYNQAILEKRSAEKDIKELETKLAKAKKKISR